MSVSKVKTVKVSVEIPESNLKALSALIGSWNGKVFNLTNSKEEDTVVETSVSTKKSAKSVVAKATSKVKQVKNFFEEKVSKSGYVGYSLKESSDKADDINLLMSSKVEHWTYKDNAYSIISSEEFKELFDVDFEEIAKLDDKTRNETANKILQDFVKQDKKSLWFKTKDWKACLLLNGYVVSLKDTTYRVPNAKNAKKKTTIHFNKVEMMKLF